jgi:DnaJ-class molecular chaperone
MTPKPPQPGQDPQHPADEVPPGTPQTAEGLCPRCGGSGTAGNSPCPDCDGTGTVNVNVGDA